MKRNFELNYIVSFTRRNRNFNPQRGCGGLRRDELVKLELENLDLDTGALLIRHGKGNKTRTVYLNERAIDLGITVAQMKERERLPWRDYQEVGKEILEAINYGKVE